MSKKTQAPKEKAQISPRTNSTSSKTGSWLLYFHNCDCLPYASELLTQLFSQSELFQENSHIKFDVKIIPSNTKHSIWTVENNWSYLPYIWIHVKTLTHQNNQKSRRWRIQFIPLTPQGKKKPLNIIYSSLNSEDIHRRCEVKGEVLKALCYSSAWSCTSLCSGAEGCFFSCAKCQCSGLRNKGHELQRSLT